MKLGDEVISHAHDAQLVARPGRIGGIMVEDLDKQLEGLKEGETRNIKVHVPDTHASEKIKDKDVEIEVKLKDLKKLELAEIDQAFLESLGFADEKELREGSVSRWSSALPMTCRKHMREQIRNYLLQAVNFELPAKLSAADGTRHRPARWI